MASSEKPRTRKPRCFLLYALAPEGLAPAEANRRLNAAIADEGLPLAVYHDHFIGQAGGFVIFYVASPEERDALYEMEHLHGWDVDVHPLIFSDSPAGLDEQIAFTLRAYANVDWEVLQKEERPAYGRDPQREAETASEDG
jgi:hypothetical protein